MAKKILVIDDDLLVLQTLKILFKKEGDIVVAVRSGKKALETVERSDFDLVIADIKMPEMDGVEAVKKIKEYCKSKNKPEIPVMFITGYADVAAQEKAGQLGEVVLKPFDMREFLDFVKGYGFKRDEVEKRVFPRVSIDLPIKIFPSFWTRSIDLSESGLSFILEGPRLPSQGKAEIRLSSRQKIETEFKVIWLEQLAEKDKFKYGVAFMKLKEGGLELLRSVILEAPGIRLTELTDKRIYDLWKLYRRSGFIYPLKRKYIVPIIKEINSTWKILYSPKTTFFKSVGYYKNNRLLGTTSVVQIYENTWLFHQLATNEHPIKLLPKQLILHLMGFLIKTPEAKYIQLYYRPNNPWPARTFGTFSDTFPIKEFIDFTLYSFLEKDLVGHEERAVSKDQFLNVSDFVVEELKDEQIPFKKFICNHLNKVIKNPLLINAYSLNENEITLPDTTRIYNEVGLKRNRHFFLLRKGESILSFVIAEDSSLGINLAGILNSFRAYDVKTDIEDFTVGKRQLIEKVLDFYRLTGNKKAILLTEEPDISIYTGMGFIKTKEYMCFSGFREGLSAFYYFMEENYAKIRRRIKFRESPVRQREKV